MHSENNHGVDLDGRVLFQTVKQNKACIMGILLFCTIMGAVYAYCKPVEYKSEAAICLRNPGVVGEGENRHTIVLLKKNPALSEVDLSFNRDSSLIMIETKKKGAQDAHDAVQKAIQNIKQGIDEINEKKMSEEYPSIDFAQREMNTAKLKYQQTPEQTTENQQLKDDYEVKAKVYERQLEAKTKSLYAVQVVNEPSFPEKPYKARRDNNILVGFLIGCLLSFFFCVKQYRKKE